MSSKPPLLQEATFVFGGAGFVGTHLLERLRRNGAGALFCVDAQAPVQAVAGVTYLKHDVRDLSSLRFEQAVPLVFNLAAVHTTPGHAPWEYYDSNVRGAIQIARFARAHQTQKICFTSSISIYGPTEDPKDEQSIPAPSSDYGRSKLMAEQIFTDWAAEVDARSLVISKPAVVFGRGEGGNFTRLARLLKGGFFVYPGRKDTIKSCIYVEDLIDWMLFATQKPEKMIVFNGAFHERYTIEAIVEAFRKVAFPNAKSFVLSARVLKLLAGLLRPLSAAGLGVHPERIEKLMVSNNILPGWAVENGLPTRERLTQSLTLWRDATKGEFH